MHFDVFSKDELSKMYLMSLYLYVYFKMSFVAFALYAHISESDQCLSSLFTNVFTVRLYSLMGPQSPEM